MRGAAYSTAAHTIARAGFQSPCASCRSARLACGSANGQQSPSYSSSERLSMRGTRSACGRSAAGIRDPSDAREAKPLWPARLVVLVNHLDGNHEYTNTNNNVHMYRYTFTPPDSLGGGPRPDSAQSAPPLEERPQAPAVGWGAGAPGMRGRHARPGGGLVTRTRVFGVTVRVSGP